MYRMRSLLKNVNLTVISITFKNHGYILLNDKYSYYNKIEIWAICKFKKINPTIKIRLHENYGKYMLRQITISKIKIILTLIDI